MSGIDDVLAGRRGWHLEVAHVLDGLARLPDGCVQCVVTSPPYWCLRAYGTEPVVMGGEAGCSHAWLSATQRGITGGTNNAYADKLGIKGTDNYKVVPDREQATCTRCHAWRGELGSEPDPARFVVNLVAIMREVRRVMRPDATCFLNIGDSYAGSWGNQGRTADRGTQRRINGPMLTPVHDG